MQTDFEATILVQTDKELFRKSEETGKEQRRTKASVSDLFVDP